MSNAIRKLRESLNLTQVELAKALKVTQVTVSWWESGRNTPTMEMLKKIKKLAKSKGIDITYEEIVGE